MKQIKTALTGLAFMGLVYLIFAIPCGFDATQWSNWAIVPFVFIEVIALVIIFLRLDE